MKLVTILFFLLLTSFTAFAQDAVAAPPELLDKLPLDVPKVNSNSMVTTQVSKDSIVSFKVVDLIIFVNFRERLDFIMPF
jgi:hypothetical protein